MRDNDGGPAFPMTQTTHVYDDGSYEWSARPGMNLRDYFAAAALSGMFASRLWHETPFDTMAAAAYRTADAMLKEREGKS